MTTYQTIQLNLLVQSKANVRHTARTEGIAELAASIAAHGLRQNLNVKPTTGGRFEVVAGARRLRALKFLAKDGGLNGKPPLPALCWRKEKTPLKSPLPRMSSACPCTRMTSARHSAP